MDNHMLLRQVRVEQLQHMNSELVAKLGVQFPGRGFKGPTNLPLSYSPEPGCPFGSPTRGQQFLDDLLEEAEGLVDDDDADRLEGEIVHDLDRHPELLLVGQALPSARATIARQHNGQEGGELHCYGQPKSGPMVSSTSAYASDSDGADDGPDEHPGSPPQVVQCEFAREVPLAVLAAPSHSSPPRGSGARPMVAVAPVAHPGERPNPGGLPEIEGHSAPNGDNKHLLGEAKFDPVPEPVGRLPIDVKHAHPRQIGSPMSQLLFEAEELGISTPIRAA